MTQANKSVFKKKKRKDSGETSGWATEETADGDAVLGGWWMGATYGEASPTLQAGQVSSCSNTRGVRMERSQRMVEG